MSEFARAGCAALLLTGSSIGGAIAGDTDGPEPNSVDHAGILQELTRENFESGKAIYQNLCVHCHGNDGIKATLPTARAFGKGELKYGIDPYSMFQTLTKGNGLMAPQTWMTPEERYDVIHYIRQAFMKPLHPNYAEIDDGYLEGLPTVNIAPEEERNLVRDFGPALSSQLGFDIPNVLTIRLRENHTIAYNLHSMDQAAVWREGYLNLQGTQHYRERGSGVPLIGGKEIAGLQAWQWAHEGRFDYPTEGLLPRGPLPEKWMEYRGHYLFGEQVVLSYTIDGREILEVPGKPEGISALTHTFRAGASEESLVLSTGRLESEEAVRHGYLDLDASTVELRDANGSLGDSLAVIATSRAGELDRFVAAGLHGDVEGMTLKMDREWRLVLTIPAGRARVFEIIRTSGRGANELFSFAGFVSHHAARGAPRDPKTMTRGGRKRWNHAIRSSGSLGADDTAYALDTLTVPDSTPWNTWFRTSALAFFPDGRLVVSTHGGDLWIVSEIEKSLANLSWQRLASGLYEPFGIQVVEGMIYVTCKDRIVRLHDRNDDGEADFYESFSADTDVSNWFHGFNFDLQRDGEGNFFYAKCGQYTSYALPGAIIKVTPDGKRREIYATGFRTPNGMGMTGDGRLTVSDNQGNWIPASKISLVREGGFYGYVQTHAHPKGLWAPDGGRIDHKNVKPPDSFDSPLIWMPQDFDNSSGGQLYVDDSRWGPLAGKLLHTSFGKGWLYYLMPQQINGVDQAAIVRLKLDGITGIHRARVNPKDGQVYAVGLNGWNGNGRKGLAQGGIHRFRYTGKPTPLLTDVRTNRADIELTFNVALETSSAADPQNYRLSQWNYRWSHGYGSKHYSVLEPDREGEDHLEVERVTLAEDRRSVRLHLQKLQPANQLKLEFELVGTDGTPIKDLVYMTINEVPAR